ncbi:hypothetical protein [Salinicola halophyticus]|uniref:hypothetical protein n=1 Tax=Salinicola halophyticus TaxID=1808881 RepID=UPI000DA1401D|nr:hypothetical protein [Salinicola halophyticus]
MDFSSASSIKGEVWGRLLLEKGERPLFAKFDDIWLETEIGSRAYAFYERASWIPVEKWIAA